MFNVVSDPVSGTRLTNSPLTTGVRPLSMHRMKGQNNKCGHDIRRNADKCELSLITRNLSDVCDNQTMLIREGEEREPLFITGATEPRLRSAPRLRWQTEHCSRSQCKLVIRSGPIIALYYIRIFIHCLLIIYSNPFTKTVQLVSNNACMH